ncbi:MAG: hypothetical protein VXY77_04560 [Pseudomonadota bacterium]|nr:hypothetical protein [Pseudomonadota bacterium]
MPRKTTAKSEAHIKLRHYFLSSLSAICVGIVNFVLSIHFINQSDHIKRTIGTISITSKSLIGLASGLCNMVTFSTKTPHTFASLDKSQLKNVTVLLSTLLVFSLIHSSMGSLLLAINNQSPYIDFLSKLTILGFGTSMYLVISRSVSSLPMSSQEHNRKSARIRIKQKLEAVLNSLKTSNINVSKVAESLASTSLWIVGCIQSLAFSTTLYRVADSQLKMIFFSRKLYLPMTVLAQFPFLPQAIPISSLLVAATVIVCHPSQHLFYTNRASKLITSITNGDLKRVYLKHWKATIAILPLVCVNALASAAQASFLFANSFIASLYVNLFSLYESLSGFSKDGRPQNNETLPTERTLQFRLMLALFSSTSLLLTPLISQPLTLIIAYLVSSTLTIYSLHEPTFLEVNQLTKSQQASAANLIAKALPSSRYVKTNLNSMFSRLRFFDHTPTSKPSQTPKKSAVQKAD